MSLSPTPNWYQRIVLLIKKTMKKKKKPSPQQPNMIPSLSDDLLLTCFALISRLYYPTLSLVCKRFRSLIASPELYETRSLLGRTESCLYVCLRFPPDTKTRWEKGEGDLVCRDFACKVRRWRDLGGC
uniref:Putative F-box/kelch-repeat protein n=2 Tax=Noccaea caerulescens TaxID=107243 RepID=A0A1J3GYH9_NOCCA